MEIDNNRIASLTTPTSGQGAPVAEQRHGSGDKGAAETTAANSGDRVSLTGEARQLKELENELASRPVVDSQRVEAVRNAVDNGTFSVDAERIADKLISLEQALTDAR